MVTLLMDAPNSKSTQELDRTIEAIVHAQDGGITDAGLSFINSNVNPAHSGNPQIPDGDQVLSTTFNQVLETTITAPLALPTPTWDMLVCSLPGSTTHLVVATGPAGTNFNTVDPAGIQVVYFTGNSAVELADIPATGPGVDTVGKPKGFSRTLKAFPPGVPGTTFRTVSQSYTVTFTGSSLNNGGSVFTARQSQGTTLPRLLATNMIEPGPPNPDLHLMWEQDRQVSFDTGDYSSSLVKEAWDAKEGVYAIIDPRARQSIAPPTTTGVGFEIPADLQIIENGTISGYIPQYSRMTTALDQTKPIGMKPTLRTPNGDRIPLLNFVPAIDMGLDGGDMKFSLFRGLHPDASFHVKSNKAIQCTVTGGLIGSTVRKAPVDIKAVNMARRVMSNIKVMYPAKDNFLAAIPGILAGAMKVLPHIVSGIGAIGSLLGRDEPQNARPVVTRRKLRRPQWEDEEEEVIETAPPRRNRKTATVSTIQLRAAKPKRAVSKSLVKQRVRIIRKTGK